MIKQIVFKAKNDLLIQKCLNWKSVNLKIQIYIFKFYYILVKKGQDVELYKHKR